MQPATQCITLTVESGLQAGVSLALPVGVQRVGSGLDCDIVVADPQLAAAHFALEGEPVPMLRALDASVQPQGSPSLQPGEACRIDRPLRFTAGGVEARAPAADPR